MLVIGFRLLSTALSPPRTRKGRGGEEEEVVTEKEEERGEDGEREVISLVTALQRPINRKESYYDQRTLSGEGPRGQKPAGTKPTGPNRSEFV